MKLAGAAHLPTITLTARTWYRAVPTGHIGNPLGTGLVISRFCPVGGAYHLIYLAEDRTTALLEVQAAVRSAHLPRPLPVALHRYAVLPVTVHGIQVVDFGDVGARRRIQASVQELTGNWRDYPHRPPTGTWPSVRSDHTDAPTQTLGAQMHAVQHIAGFLSASTYNATKSNLIIFPARVTLNARGNPHIGPRQPHSE